MPRRKLTLEDEQEITKRSDYGEHPEKIAAALGLSLKAVVSYLERD